MQALSNIEKSAFHKGEYVGYANGVWRIMRANFHIGTRRIRWTAFHRDRKHHSLEAQTLREISKQLSRIS